jgi:hypothetical protein
VIAVANGCVSAPAAVLVRMVGVLGVGAHRGTSCWNRRALPGHGVPLIAASGMPLRLHGQCTGIATRPDTCRHGIILVSTAPAEVLSRSTLTSSRLRHASAASISLGRLS